MCSNGFSGVHLTSVFFYHPLYSGGGDGARSTIVGDLRVEQIRFGRFGRDVLFKPTSQVLAQRHIAIEFAFLLLYKDSHAVKVNVAQSQCAELVASEPTAV